ncbi:hypothetical protein DXG01_011419 [Tephrocybe rancida]|nr:hypothetical protein DXG01_011419 [Tephrocybe rancida]
MAGFLRKKPKQDQRTKSLAAAPPPPSAASTPLFAKFASAKQAEGPRVVSSPMLLSSARRDTMPSHQPRASQAAGHLQQRDGNSRGQSLESSRESAGGYPDRLPNRGAAAALQNRPWRTRTQLDQPQRDGRNDSTDYFSHLGAPVSQDNQRGQAVVHPGLYDNTRFQPSTETAANIPIQRGNRDSAPPPTLPMLEKLLPAHEEEESPIQGEYAHLWSMIAGDDVQLPEIPEGSTDNPAPRKAFAQESGRHLNVTFDPGLVSDPPVAHSNSPFGGSRPIASPEVDLRSQPLPPSRQVPLANGASNSRTSLHFDAGENPSKPQKSYEYANHDDIPEVSIPTYFHAARQDVFLARLVRIMHVMRWDTLRSFYAHISRQSSGSAPLSTSPSANRKLVKSTKPAGQPPPSITRSQSAAQGVSANRPGFPPSQPAQVEAPRSHYPPSDIMGANISAPDGSVIQQHRALYKEPIMVTNNPHRVATPPTAYAPSQQRMSVQFTPTPAAISPPRKSSSMRAAAAGKVTGKPLIFTAMAAVDQRPGPPVAAPHPAISSPPVVQYRNWPDSGPYPQQQQHPQPQHHHAPPPPAVLLPPRRESVRPYPQPPPPQTPPKPHHRASIVGHGIQAGPSAIRPPSAASQIIIPTPTVPVMSPKAPHHAPQTNGYPTPPHDEQPSPSLHVSSSRTRKSRSQPSVDHSHTSIIGGPSDPKQRTPVKVRPTTPLSPGNVGPIQIDGDVLGVPLDDDPFAKTEGVKLLMPTISGPPSPIGTEGTGRRRKSRDGRKDGEELHSDSGSFEPSRPASARLHSSPSPMSSDEELRRASAKVVETHPIKHMVMVPPPLLYGKEGGRDCLTGYLGDAKLLGILLGFFSFYDWCMILSLSRDIRFMIVQSPMLRETVLERFLKTVGYARWGWNEPDPLSLSLQDLNDYMRGVSTPTHEYARIAALYNHSLYVHPSHRDLSLYDTVRHLAASTRAYTRVVLRLRAQGEKEITIARFRGGLRGGSRPASRAPSPTFSHSNHSHGSVQNSQPQNARPAAVTFQSPLFRLKRAPLLRVFVPSPDGDWLSDKSVLECEAECRRAGVRDLMRFGDVVWDVAVGDEGNVGRLVWDGSYLIDLDYSYSPIGDLPKYMPTFAFPPSYFHRVIRTGPNSSNPIVHIDLRPWGEEIAANLQLLQDRVRTETPQGAYHNVVRWVHRSSFVIRPLARGQVRSPMSISHYSNAHAGHMRVPIPDCNLFVDPGWYGTIVVETEGTNESLADLQDRCGPGVFPPRPAPVNGAKPVDRDSKLVFRILREKSFPNIYML